MLDSDQCETSFGIANRRMKLPRGVAKMTVLNRYYT